MDQRCRLALQKSHKELIKDLDVKVTLDHLFARLIITLDDVQRVEGMVTDRDRRRTLLTILPGRGQEAFDELCESLSDQPWLKDILEKNHKNITEEELTKSENLDLQSGLSERRELGAYLFCPKPEEQPEENKRSQDIERIEDNWRTGRHTLQRIHCNSKPKGAYCLQYDDQKIVSGLRDDTIKIWDRSSLECVQVLTGHTGSVLCLQYDDNIIISGSSDSTVKLWDVRTGELLKTLSHHSQSVISLRFADGIVITGSRDRTIAVLDMQSPTDIKLRTLLDLRSAVNDVDFDQKYIVSASGDRTIKVWKTSSCELVRTLNGHKRGVACLQYRERLVVSGSSDNTIRIWDIENGECLRVLEGHESLVRCIRFDTKRIISGAYDGQIKVWDLAAALDHRAPASTLCLRTLMEHSGRVFQLQFDDFQIVSSSGDDLILIWNFVNVPVAETQPYLLKKP